VLDDEPRSFADCVAWARLLFEDHFCSRISQLLTNFPKDKLKSNGTPFWTSPRRCPHPLHFDVNDVSALFDVRFINFMLNTLTHSPILRPFFPGEPGLAGCPLNLLLHLFLDCASFWDRPKLSMSFLTKSHQVFFGRPLCLIPSSSHVMQRLTQSL